MIDRPEPVELRTAGYPAARTNLIKVCFVDPPSQSINAGGGIAFEREERHPE